MATTEVNENEGVDAALEKMNTNENEIDNSTAAFVIPPDSGWAWVVMFASFLCCTVIDGIVFCSGLIQEYIIVDFNVSKGYLAFVSSLLSGCYLMAGPFVSALANRFGFRVVTIAGAIFSSVFFGISYFATSVEFLFITYGILGGIGFCMVYIPAVVIIGFYFEKWRALATGVALCGSGVGTFIFAPLTNALLKNFGWRETLAIQGGIIMLCAIFGIAFRPIQPVTLQIADDFDDTTKNDANGRETSHPKQSRFHEGRFSKPLPEGRFAYSMPNSAHNTYMGNTPKHQYPTAADVFRGVNLERKSSNSSNRGIELKALRKSQPTTPNSETQQFSFNHNKELSTVGENEEEPENGKLLSQDSKKPIVTRTRRHTVSERRPTEFAQKRHMISSQETVHVVSSRPMYRDDIFFTGSLRRIPQYQSQSSLAYHMSVTRLPTKQDILEERQSECRICGGEAVRRTLANMLDISLLKSPSFMLLSFSGFLTMMGFFVPFTFLKPRAVLAGMDENAALNVVSGIGLVNTIARVVCGTMSSFPSVKPLWLNNFAITAGGIATIFSGVYINEATQWTFAVFFGICIACFSALRSLIAVEMIGLEKLTNAFGFLMLFQGLAATIGSPIAGALFDMTGSYDVSFYFAGGLILLSAFLCYPLTYVANWEKRTQAQKVENAVIVT